MDIPKQTDRELLAGLPSSSLFDLARNGSTRWSVRKASVALLIAQSDPRAKHPELAELVYAVAAETLGAGPRSDIEWPFKASDPWPHAHPPKTDYIDGLDVPVDLGPFRASVTTETMFRDENDALNQDSQNRFSFPDSETRVYEKLQLPKQPIVSIDVPALESLSVTSPAPALYDPEQ